MNKARILYEKVPDTAFIDDTTWIAKSQQDLEHILTIAQSFFALNDILINNNKATLITNNNSVAGQSIQLNIGSHSVQVKVESNAKSVRILDVWFSVQQTKHYIIEQIKDEIRKDCDFLWFKKVIDKQMLYIFNTVIVPRLEFKTQLTFIPEHKYHSLTAPFRTLFKHKLTINKCSPNAILTNPLIYRYKELYDNQIQAKVSNLLVQLNDLTIVGRTTFIRIKNFQIRLLLHRSPLEEWPFNKTHDFKDHIADLLCVLPDFNITLQLNDNSLYQSNIEGGTIPLHRFLPQSIYLKHLDKIAHDKVWFFDQLISPEGQYLVKWQDRMLHYHIHNKTPIWFKELEKKLLHNPDQSRRLPDQYRITTPSISPVNPDTLFNNNVFYCNSWIYSWLTSFNCLVIGKIIKSLNTEVIVEHWI